MIFLLIGFIILIGALFIYVVWSTLTALEGRNKAHNEWLEAREDLHKAERGRRG